MPKTPISFATTPQPGPDGTLSVTITHLEMTRAPSGSAMRSPAAGLAILRVKTPTVPFYRFLYNHVGEPWLWYERRAMSDKTLTEVLSHEKNQVYVLYREGDPAGYVEFDYRDEREAVLAYFGLLPGHIGNKLGPWFLDWAVRTAWLSKPARLIVNTCNLDHPKAIIVYQRVGFRPYHQEQKIISDPRQSPFWLSPPDDEVD
ncbi:MAG: GNAT family N-acetyltransferase [Arenicellales bacterium]